MKKILFLVLLFANQLRSTDEVVIPVLPKDVKPSALEDFKSLDLGYIMPAGDIAKKLKMARDTELRRQRNAARTEEEKQKARNDRTAKDQEKRAKMTPEQLARYRADRADSKAALYAELPLAEKQKKRAAARAKYELNKEALAKKRAEKRKAMTPAES